VPHRLRRLGPVLPALAAAVFGIVRLPELTRSPFWFDELFSLDVVSLPVGDSMRRIIADHTNPPLFYVLLKGWVAIGGDGDLWARLLPCLFALLLGPALVWLSREARAGTMAGALAVALAAASPLTVDLANEVRAYSLLALLACLSLAGALRARRLATPQAFALLTLVNVALVHTHYFGWLTVGAEVGTAVLCWPREARREMARSAALTALAFLPWASAVISHALRHPAPLRNVAWIAPPDAAAPLWLFADLTGRWSMRGANLVWLAVAAVALGALAWSRLQERRHATATAPDSGTLTLLAFAGLGAPLAVWGLSVLWSHSVWVPRYLLGAAAPVALLTAIALTALPPRRAPVAALAGFVWAIVAFATLPQRAPVKFDWRRFVRRLDVAVGSPRDVVAFEAFTGAPLQRYAAPGMRVHMAHALDSVSVVDSWVVYRPESFPNSSPALRLRAMGFTIVTSLSAESAGQRMVALRVKR
jgi:mannosyltransferase